MDALVDVVRLVVPSRDFILGFMDAMNRGWSPSTIRDVRPQTLAEIEADADEFLFALNGPPNGRTVELSDGRVMPWLSQIVRWVWDGEFCGVITLRYQAGSDDLPDHMLGHVGYHIVPWKQKMGRGTAALRLMLPEAKRVGLTKLIMSARPVNIGTRKIIEANGGVEVGRFVNPLYSMEERIRYHVPL